MRSVSRPSTPWKLTALGAAFSLMFLASVASAQVGVRIYGKVLDQDGKPVKGAEVKVVVWEEGSEQSVVVETDRKGRYRTVMMHNSKAYKFIVNKEGFETLEYLDEGGLKRTNWNAPVHNDFELKPGGASESSEGAVLKGGKGAPAAYNRGVKARKAEDFETARDEFTQAVTEDPNFALGQAALASTLYDLEEYEAAVQHAMKTVELDPGVRSYELLYRTALDAEDSASVAKALDGLARTRPDKKTARLLYNEGVGAFQTEDHGAAEEYFKRSLKLDPDLHPAGRALARTYLKLERYEDALAEAQRLVNIDRHDLEALDVLQRAREALPAID